MVEPPRLEDRDWQRALNTRLRELFPNRKVGTGRLILGATAGIMNVFDLGTSTKRGTG